MIVSLLVVPFIVVVTVGMLVGLGFLTNSFIEFAHEEPYGAYAIAFGFTLILAVIGVFVEAGNTHRKNRIDSLAPISTNVEAQ